MDPITQALDAVAQGDPRAASQLLPLVYDELRRLAAHSWPGKCLVRRSRPPPWSTKPTCVWSARRGAGLE